MNEQLSLKKLPELLKVEKNSDKCVSIKGNEELEVEFYEYAINFKKSALILAEHLVKSNDISELDTYFFSLAYLYRHSLELLMKSVVFKHVTDYKKRVQFVKDSRHNLFSILVVIKELIENESGNNALAINWLEKLFSDMNKIDKESDSFRYPFGIITHGISKEYKIKPFFDEQTHINLICFVNKMEIAFSIIRSLYLGEKQITYKYTEYNPIFLEEGGSYYDQSVLGYKYNSMQFFPFVKAYAETAELFYDFAKEQEDLRSIIFFPMCYLYRNAIELAMKEILFEECSDEFQSKLKVIKKKKKHSIEGLWNSIKGDMEEALGENSFVVFGIARFVQQLHSFDVYSDKFRYPTNTDLKLHYEIEKSFDIESVNLYFKSFSGLLYSAHADMSEYNEYKAEMISEYRDHYRD